MRILLVQHGDAVSKEVDPERPLSDQGRSDVERVAACLNRAAIRVSRALHSGKTRARQTAELLGARLGPEGPVEAVSNLNPNDAVDEWVTKAGTWNEDTILVGHMPFMGKLASTLMAGEGSPVSVEFRPGSIVCLQRSEDARWHLCWMIRPDMAAGEPGVQSVTKCR